MQRMQLLLAVALLSLPAGTTRLAAQAGAPSGTLTVQQVENRFRNMNEIHILKCDWNGDGLIEPKEFPCVQGIYNTMYLSR